MVSPLDPIWDKSHFEDTLKLLANPSIQRKTMQSVQADKTERESAVFKEKATLPHLVYQGKTIAVELQGELQLELA